MILHLVVNHANSLYRLDLKQLDHFNRHELGWSLRMIGIGFINNVGFGVMLAFLIKLSQMYDRNLQCAQFIVAV